MNASILIIPSDTVVHIQREKKKVIAILQEVTSENASQFLQTGWPFSDRSFYKQEARLTGHRSFTKCNLTNAPAERISQISLPLHGFQWQRITQDEEKERKKKEQLIATTVG